MSAGVMMMLGAAVFSVNGTSYNQIVRTANFTWQSQKVIGKQPVYQYLGHGEKNISIEGKIFPGQYGNRASLLILEQSAGLGLPLPLFTGGGLTFGAWCVTRYKETDLRMMDTGDPREIDFTVDLVQYAGLADYLTEQASQYIKNSSLTQSYLQFLN